MPHVPCYIAAAGSGRAHPEKRFPLSRTGWKNARDYAFKMRDVTGIGMTVLVCPGTIASRVEQPGIPLYMCDKDSGRACFIEGYSGDVVLAGGRRRSGRRR